MTEFAPILLIVLIVISELYITEIFDSKSKSKHIQEQEKLIKHQQEFIEQLQDDYLRLVGEKFNLK